MFKELKVRNNFLQEIAIILLILLVGLILRVYNLDRYDLWYDEAIIAIDGHGLDSLPSLNRLLDKKFVTKYNQDYLALYNHGFAYYWRKAFGNSEFALRSSSVIVGILTIFFLFIFCRIFFDKNIAMISSFLLSISPLHIHYSQEFAPYIFLPFLSLISFYSLVKVMETERTKYWFLYGISVTVGIYFRYMMLLSLLSFLLLFLLITRQRCRKKEAILFCLSHAIIFILILPCFLTIYPLFRYYIYEFSHKTSQLFTGFPSWAEKITWKHLVFTMKNFAIGYNVEMKSCTSIVSMILYISFFLWGMLRCSYRYKNFLLGYFIFPIITLFLLSQLKSCYVYRYLFFLLPFFLLGVAMGLSRMPRQSLFALFVGIFILNSLALRSYYTDVLPSNYDEHIAVVQKMDGIKEVARFISREFKEGDRILHLYNKTVFPLKFYMRPENNLPASIKEVERGSIVYISEGGGSLMHFDYKSSHPRIADVEDTRELKKNSRLWIIFSSFAPRNVRKENLPEYSVISLIQDEYTTSRHQKFGDVEVYLFSRKLRNQ